MRLSILAMLASFVSLLTAPLAAQPLDRPLRPVVVFDLDHTLTNPNPRILAILHEIGLKRGLPQLQSLALEDIERSQRGHLRVSMETLLGGNRRDSDFARFYQDPSYLIYDSPKTGGAAFVRRILSEMDVDILYLTGRLERFREATQRQLAYFNYPGFGEINDPLKSRVHLFLKPETGLVSVAQFKLSVLQGFERSGMPVLGVFEDSKTNLNHLRAHLHPSTIMIHVTPDVGNRQNLAVGIEQITDFRVNVSFVRDLQRVVGNSEQLDGIVTDLKKTHCMRLLAP